MKFAIVNLPNRQRLTRRYMCSYVSPISLFPPVELLSAAAVIKQCSSFEVSFIDAIADRLSTENTIKLLAEIKPDYLLTLTGFECFDEDIENIQQIKSQLPKTQIILFGHYPTLFPDEIINNTAVDIILKGEPENTLAEILPALETNTPFVHAATVIRNTIKEGAIERIRNIATLPQPAYELMDASKYFEPFMPRPFGMVQTARGCPYNCNYCVKSYGSRLSLRSAEQVVDELQMLKDVHGIKSFRFIDDTFTVNHHRVKEICALMIERKLNLEWTCLSRTDNIKPDMLTWMRKAGCRRIYFGIESGSQRMLDIYDKGIKVEEALVALQETRKAGIETTGFFMMGLPDETEADFEETIQFALKANLSLVSIGGITLYPGTSLFNKYRDQIEFSLFPYVNRFKDSKIEERYHRWEKKFYRHFYFRPSYALRLVSTYAKQPVAVFQTVKDAVTYPSKGFDFIPGIKKNMKTV